MQRLRLSRCPSLERKKLHSAGVVDTGTTIRYTDCISQHMFNDRAKFQPTNRTSTIEVPHTLLSALSFFLVTFSSQADSRRSLTVKPSWLFEDNLPTLYASPLYIFCHLTNHILALIAMLVVMTKTSATWKIIHCRYYGMAQNKERVFLMRNTLVHQHMACASTIIY